MPETQDVDLLPKDVGGAMAEYLRHARPKSSSRTLFLSLRVLGMAYSGLGAWAIARHVVMQQALKTKTPNQYGFNTMENSRNQATESRLVQPPDVWEP